MSITTTKLTELQPWVICLGWLVAITMIQTIAFWLPWVSLLTIVPLIGLLVPNGDTSFDAQRPQRIYFSCLLIGITSIAGEVSAISSAISHSLALDAAVSPLLAVVDSLPRLALRIVLPGAVGVLGYTVLMHIDNHQKPAVESPKWIEQLKLILEQSNAPAEICQFLETLSGQLATTGQQYQAMSGHTEAANRNLVDLTGTFETVDATMRRFLKRMSDNDTQLKQLQQQVVTAQTGIGQIESQVNEMGSVLDQFAEIASHQVLQTPVSPPAGNSRTSTASTGAAV